MRKIYHEHGGTLGYRVICDIMNRQGIAISYATAHAYMKEMGLKAIIMQKKQPYKKGHKHQIFKNLINRDFTVDAPYKVWCIDFTYLNLKNGAKRYNCSILDLYDRSIVASKNSKWIDSNLAISTVKEAIERFKIKDDFILHSDQGSQFASKEFIDFCKENGITQSMSRAGNPYDNAPMERFYNTLKSNLINQYVFETDDELNEAMFDFIFDWYNHRRPHSYNKGKTPFEKRHSN